MFTCELFTSQAGDTVLVAASSNPKFEFDIDNLFQKMRLRVKYVLLPWSIVFFLNFSGKK